MSEKVTGFLYIDTKKYHMHVPSVVYNNLKMWNYKYAQPDYLLRAKMICIQCINEKTLFPIKSYKTHSVILKIGNFIKEIFGPGAYHFKYLTNPENKLIIELDYKAKSYPVYPEIK